MEALEIIGRETVIECFGSWPSFHDAEVISIFLARKGQSIIRIHPCYPVNPAMVDFVLEEVTDLELSGFSPQNVLFDLHIEMITDKNGNNLYRITLDDIYGIGGKVDAKLLRVELVDFKSNCTGSKPQGE